MPRVLIVEDESAVYNILKEKLLKEGFDVVLATTVQECLSLLSPPPDLVLLDIMLPGGKNGFDFLESIKHNPLLSNIPVIVLTNLDTEESTANSIGASSYLVKANTPIKDVIEKVKSLINK